MLVAEVARASGIMSSKVRDAPQYLCGDFFSNRFTLLALHPLLLQ